MEALEIKAELNTYCYSVNYFFASLRRECFIHNWILYARENSSIFYIQHPETFFFLKNEVKHKNDQERWI